MDALSIFALILLVFVVLTLAYGMIAIHDIPYNIAKKMNHPHQDSIHAGGWVSLFTLHAIWPFLWIWATLYHPEHGYAGRPPKNGAEGKKDQESRSAQELIRELQARVEKLEAEAKTKG